MKIITFYCPKGGVGKSTLSKNFAVFLSLVKQHKVLFLDLDRQRHVMQASEKHEDWPFIVLDRIPDNFGDVDYVVGDISPVGVAALSVEQKQMLENSDLIISPFEADSDNIDSMVDIYNLQTKAIIKPVLNKFTSTSKLHKEALSVIKDCLVLKSRSAYPQTSGANSIFFKNPYSSALSNARNDFKQLANKLLELVK
ncbi:AAA family ATPase [Alteromonas sp. 345S023]|uniref:AAA family ATPase n=1 Tax=Alteromonas profundi TaxID=2696062 RepID=A0A7X5LPC2_9ALTE|nr:ParA family protein [Alteromonas profundi]NDV93095.1 AAA family ATPase [Alteromonas profundi]